MFNLITGTHKSKSLEEDISRNCRCKLDGERCNSKQIWNKDKCLCKCKNPLNQHGSKKR